MIVRWARTRKNSLYISYVLWRGSCLLTQILRDCCDNSTGIALRILKHYIANSTAEAWLRVSYDSSEYFRKFAKKLSKTKIAYKIVYRGKNNVVMWVAYPLNENCRNCLLVSPPSKSMLKTSIATPLGVIHEILHVNTLRVQEGDAEIISTGRVEEVMKYMLTPKEQTVVYTAYARGYYDVPRRTGLNELARELNLGISTLNEILRSAERKIIEAFIKHDMPHLTFKKILEKTRIPIVAKEPAIEASGSQHYQHSGSSSSRE